MMHGGVETMGMRKEAGTAGSGSCCLLRYRTVYTDANTCAAHISPPQRLRPPACQCVSPSGYPEGLTHCGTGGRSGS